MTNIYMTANKKSTVLSGLQIYSEPKLGKLVAQRQEFTVNDRESCSPFIQFCLCISVDIKHRWTFTAGVYAMKIIHPTEGKW